MASKNISMAEVEDALPDNESSAAKKEREKILVRSEETFHKKKYEDIRKLAAPLSPGSRRKIDTILKKLETTPPAEQVSFLVTGKTGAGKSTLTNGVLGVKVDEKGSAEEGHSIQGRCTTEVREYKKNHKGIDIIVWDSPGLQDGTQYQEQYLKEMKSNCSKVDLVMFCIKVTDTRFVRGKDNPDVVAMEKLTRVFGKDFWEKTIIILTFANTLEAFNIDWEDLSDSEKANAFNKKINEWREQIRDILIGDIQIPKDVVQAIRMVPTGHPRKPKLPGIDYWLTYLWFHCVWTLPTVETQIAMIKINEDRMKKAEDVSKDDFRKSIDQQPLVVGGHSVAKVLAIGGGGGVATGAGIGALIGIVGGPPGMAIGAGIGALVGVIVGGGLGGIFKAVVG